MILTSTSTSIASAAAATSRFIAILVATTRVVSRRTTAAATAAAAASTFGHGDSDVQVVADDELFAEQSGIVIGSLGADGRGADLFHTEAGEARIGPHDREVERAALGLGVRIDFGDELGELFERRVHPRVDLQLVAGHGAAEVGALIVAAVCVAEDAQQQRTCLLAIDLRLLVLLGQFFDLGLETHS